MYFNLMIKIFVLLFVFVSSSFAFGYVNGAVWSKVILDSESSSE